MGQADELEVSVEKGVLPTFKHRSLLCLQSIIFVGAEFVSERTVD
jgi:hypothetical protein